ncbi:hypothetical protein MMC13_000335 [Lambiella insularis]|nr:hypothetical protein [Lambiella insularis]
MSGSVASRGTGLLKNITSAKPKKVRKSDKPSALSAEFVVDSDSDRPVESSKPLRAAPKSVAKATATHQKPTATNGVPKTTPKSSVPAKRKTSEGGDRELTSSAKWKKPAPGDRSAQSSGSPLKSVAKTKSAISSQPIPTAAPTPKDKPTINDTSKVKPATNGISKNKIAPKGVGQSSPLTVHNKQTKADRSSSEEENTNEEPDSDEDEDASEDGEDQESVVKARSNEKLVAQLAVLKKSAASLPHRTPPETPKPTPKETVLTAGKKGPDAGAKVSKRGESSSEDEEEVLEGELQGKSIGKPPSQLGALMKGALSVSSQPLAEAPKPTTKMPSQGIDKRVLHANDKASEENESSQGTGEDDDDEESSESSQSDTADAQNNVTKTSTRTKPTSTPVHVYKPPPGFSPANNSRPIASPLPNLFSQSNLATKQIWHITLPASVPISALSEISMDSILKGTTAFNYNYTDYALVPALKHTQSTAHVLMPSDHGNEYVAAPGRIVKSLHVQQVLRLPDLTRASQELQASKETGSGTANAAVSQGDGVTTQLVRHKEVHEQPKGLKMRFKPVGDIDNGPETLWTDSEEERAKLAENPRAAAFRMPPGHETVQSKAKRKADEAIEVERETQESPKKKQKMQETIREAGLSGGNTIPSMQEAKTAHSPPAKDIGGANQASSARKSKIARKEQEESPASGEIPPSNQEMARRLSFQSNGKAGGSQESPETKRKKHKKERGMESDDAGGPPALQHTVEKHSSLANGTENGREGRTPERKRPKKHKKGEEGEPGAERPPPAKTKTEKQPIRQSNSRKEHHVGKSATKGTPQEEHDETAEERAQRRAEKRRLKYERRDMERGQELRHR